MAGTHHALLVIGGYADAVLLLPEEDRTEDADTLHMTYAQLGVADARMVHDLAHQRPVVRAERVFVVAFDRATTEAQNALLKLLEDPPAQVRFYLVVPREDACIPTLRSRLLLYGVTERVATHEAREFLALPYAARLELVAEKTKEKDRAWASALLNGLETWVGEQPNADAALRDLILVRGYDRTRGASLKMLLEHLALSFSAETKVNTKS